MKIETEIAGLKYTIEQNRKRIKWLRQRKKILEKLPEARMCGTTLDFDDLPHAEVIKVVRALGGKWKKDKNSVRDGRVDYTQKIDGMDVRCWAGEPPPSCRLVEIEVQVPEEHIPAKTIPAHTKKVFKMVCSGDEPLAVAMSRVTNPISE